MVSMDPQAAYHELIRRTREEALLVSCLELLGWDELTYMPRAGAIHRGNQMALLSGLYHEMATAPRLGELLAELENSSLVRDPLSVEAVNLREIRRAYDRRLRLPRTLVEELARVTTLAQQAWEAARREVNFARFQPWLAKVVFLKQQEAAALGSDVPYDALLEEYEPGARSAEIAELFQALRQDLIPLVDALTHASRQANVTILRRAFPLDRQRFLSETVAAAVGFDFQGGRLDTTVHPFCSALGPGDCRLATRFNLHNFSDGFFSTLHEVGHGLYEQGLDPQHQGTPMGEVPSLALHESQSRLWENTIGRSRPFWEHFYPLTRSLFHSSLRGVSLDDFYFAVNHVESSPLRALADEATYNLHILVRFDLERALVAGVLKAEDVPAAWAEAYRHYLGITPGNDLEGCLQDGHWASGLIGYFPTYTLGNLFAAQLFAQVGAELGNLDEAFAQGRFHGLLDWLRAKVHRQGHRFPAPLLIERVTGTPLDHRPFIQALRRKYEELYDI
jgi:carboxypeptidase Taq